MVTKYTPSVIYLLSIIGAINLICITFLVISFGLIIFLSIWMIQMKDKDMSEGRLFAEEIEMLKKWRKIAIIAFFATLAGCIFIPSRQTIYDMVTTQYYIENGL